MTNTPAFQFYPSDWLSDAKVIVMTSAQEGAYIRALCFCWREGSIPTDREKLKKLLFKPDGVISDEDLRVVQGCFNQSPTDHEKMVHPRLEKEVKKQQEWREKSLRGAQKSAEKRRNNAKLKGGSRVVKPPGSSSSSSSSLDPKEEKNKIGASLAHTILSYLNEKSGKLFKPTESNLRLIRARISEGHVEADFKKAIENKCADWLDDPKMEEYLRPATLFSASKFEGYVNQINSGESKNGTHQKHRQQYETAQQRNDRRILEEIARFSDQPGGCDPGIDHQDVHIVP